MRYTKSANKVLKIKNLDPKSHDMQYNVLQILPRYYYKPSNFIKNNLFYLTTSTANDLKDNIISDLKKELVKQEFSSLYKKTYSEEYNKQLKLIKNLTPATINKAFPNAVSTAKIKHFKELFNEIDGKSLNYITLNLHEETLDSKQKFADIATLAYLQREINANPTFVLNVVKAIEKAEVLERDPVNLEEKIAKKYSYIYKFNFHEKVAEQLAEEEAEAVVLNHYENHNNNLVIERKINAVATEARKILDDELNLKERLHRGMKESSPYYVISQRIEKINKRILGDYKQAIYNDSMGFVQNSAFNSINVVEFKERNLGRKYQAVDFPLVMRKYSKEISQIINYNSIIANIEKEIDAIKKANLNNNKEGFSFETQKEKLKLYKTATELIYNKIEIAEMQNSVKNITNNMGVTITDANQNLLEEKQKEAVFKNIDLFIKNAPSNFEQRLRKSMKLNTSRFSSIAYKELLSGIKYFIAENNKNKISNAEKLQKAEKVVEGINNYIENNAGLPTTGSKAYYNQVNKLKLELAVKRFAELSKSANDLSVLSRIYNHQANQLKNNNLKIKISKDNVLDTEFIQIEIDKAYNDINNILKAYSHNRTELNKFVYEFVQGIRVEIANTPSPKVKRNLLNAYAEPLLRSDIIKNSKELTDIVEVLATREKFFFMKSHEELATARDVAKMHEDISLKISKNLMLTNLEGDRSIAEGNTSRISLEQLNQDAMQFTTTEVLIEKLKNFEKLNARDKIEVLNNVELQNSVIKTRSPINYSRFVLNPAGLDGEVGEALESAILSNKKLLEKYENGSEQDKINFLVLSMHRQNTEKTFRMRKNKPERKEVKKRYNLSDEQSIINFKEDLFWKIQFMAIEKKSKNGSLLPKTNTKLSKHSANLIKLIDIASNGVEGVKQDRAMVNYEKLARNSLVAYNSKGGKLLNEAGAVRYILGKSYDYFNSQEFNNAVLEIVKNKDIAKQLRYGAISLEELIEKETENKKSILKNVVAEIISKTSNHNEKDIIK